MSLAPQTPQEIFDTVARHLLTQNKRATNGDSPMDNAATWCRYRTPDGLRCAGGCLIPDDRYEEAFEGLGWCAPGPVSRSPAVWARFKALREEIGHEVLIGSLQGIHDVYDPRVWMTKLRELAMSYHFQTNVLDEFGGLA